MESVTHSPSPDAIACTVWEVWVQGVLGFHMQTLIIYERGYNQNYNTFALISLMKIVLCSKLSLDQAYKL